MYYADVIKLLNKSRLKYLIVGGIAVNLYGIRRLTRDLDLMIDIPGENLEKFALLMKKIGYHPSIPLAKAREFTALSFRHFKDEYKEIDIFIKNPISFERAYRRRRIIKIGRVNFYCASTQDLIEMKTRAGRDRDWIDIGALKKLQGAE